MTKRERIMSGMGLSGGTTAPRRNQIKAALSPRQPRGPGGKSEIPRRLPPPMHFPQIGPGGPRQRRLEQPLGGSLVASARKAQGQPTGMQAQRFGAERAAVGEAAQPGLGAQLSKRVQSGAIDQGQAQKVSRQRQMLQKAFGSDWRKQVFGAGGAKGISGPFAQRQVAAKRAQGLGRAKRKLS